MRTFAPAIERESVGRETIKIIGALVQLVRIHACHAWGHGFESRTHRNKKAPKVLNFRSFFVVVYRKNSLNKLSNFFNLLFN